LAQAESYRVNLVIPQNAQIWQSSINLKLLKREADYYDKKVTLVVADDNAASLAERIGFETKMEADFIPEPEPEKETPAELLAEDEEEIPVDEEEPIIEEPAEEPLPAEPLRPKTEEEIIDNLWAERHSLPSDGGEEPRQPMESLPAEPLIRQEAPQDAVPIYLASAARKPKKRLDDMVRGRNKVNLFSAGLLKSFSFKRKKTPGRNKPIFPRQLEKIEAIKELRWSKYFVIFIGLALLVAFAVVYLVLPSAEIVIEPNSESVSFDVLAVGSEDILEADGEMNKIPLQRIKVSETESREFSASGEKEVNAKAKGAVIIYNEYSSEPQTLVATTRFESGNGKIYRIEKNLLVPGAKIQEGRIIASSIEAEVVADLPGKEYNVGLTDFTIPGFKGTPKYAGFYAKSKTEITGGAIGKVKVVSADDLKKAEEELKAKLREKTAKLLEKQTPDKLKLLEQGEREEAVSAASAKENEITEKFTLETTLIKEALLFDEEDIKKIAELNLVLQIGSGKKSLPKTQQIQITKPAIDWGQGKASFYLHVKEDVITEIDQDALKRELLGKNEVEVRKILAGYPEIKKAKVSFRPFWVKKVPMQENKVKITVSID